MKGINRVTLFFAALSLVLGVAFTCSVTAYINLENSMPHLLPGEEPEFDFNAVDSKGYRFNGDIYRKKTVLLFIYRDSDRTTDNWLIWSSIAEMAAKLGAKSYGLILNEGFNRFYYALEKMDKDEWFKVLAPIEREKFLKTFRIKYNLSQTIVIHRGSIKMVKFGKLLDEDYEDLMRLIKNLPEE